MITFDRVTKRYGDMDAVHELSLEIPSGEIVIFVGPSGCGKTTSLKMINRLIEPSSGVISIDGQDTAQRDVNELRRSIGYVIQQIGLFPHHTVAENVATVPRLQGWDKKRIAARVSELLDLVELPATDYAKRLPAELSGGERQRVGVARALAVDPNIMLMDEPFGAIDPIARERLQNELLRLQSVVRKTIVFVTHDIDEAIRLGDRVALFSKGGHLEQYATPAELLAHPASDFVAGFLGEARMVRRLSLIRVGDIPLAALSGTPPPRCPGRRSPRGRWARACAGRERRPRRRRRRRHQARLAMNTVALRRNRGINLARVRLFSIPIAVLVGLALASALYQTISGSIADSQIINYDFLSTKLIEHLVLSGVSFGIVAALMVPLGVLISGAGRAVRVPVFLLANVGQAVPGIGILALLYAFLGLGQEPTIIALVIYGALPVLRNTVAGIQGVDPAAVEAARGMGMTRWQGMYRVQLPLASPLIFAGLRTALVLIIGTATLGNFIGGGGLGDVIASGINISNRIIFVGAVMVSALALLADWALSLVERMTVPRAVTT
jgi:ABC-type proline/glycine betaine transport system ATPase subunit/ABC-type proline/glycine betaine transport system permease subunit